MPRTKMARTKQTARRRATTATDTRATAVTTVGARGAACGSPLRSVTQVASPATPEEGVVSLLSSPLGRGPGGKGLLPVFVTPVGSPVGSPVMSPVSSATNSPRVSPVGTPVRGRSGSASSSVASSLDSSPVRSEAEVVAQRRMWAAKVLTRQLALKRKQPDTVDDADEHEGEPAAPTRLSKSAWLAYVAGQEAKLATLVLEQDALGERLTSVNENIERLQQRVATYEQAGLVNAARQAAIKAATGLEVPSDLLSAQARVSVDDAEPDLMYVELRGTDSQAYLEDDEDAVAAVVYLV